MPITTNKAQITSQHKGRAFFNICHADPAGVMVWGTQSNPTLLCLVDGGFGFHQFEDEESLEFWLTGMDDKGNFIIKDDAVYEIKYGNENKMIAISEVAQLNIQKIRRIFPDCTDEKIIERALEMMAAKE